MRSSADRHVGDLDFGEVLPVSRMTPISGAPREPENPDFLALAMADDLGGDLGALHARHARLDVLAVAGHEDLVERDLVPRLRIEQRDLDRDARLGAELLAAGGENGVGHRARNLTRDNWLVKRPHTAPSPLDPPAAPSS